MAADEVYQISSCQDCPFSMEGNFGGDFCWADGNGDLPNIYADECPLRHRRIVIEIDPKFLAETTKERK